MQKINGGYYIKARCIKDSSISNSPPYIREIWDYLLREANHKDIKYNGYVIKRGQLFRSYKDIRDDLSWKVGYRTERYNENQMKMGMRYLKKQLMITLSKQPRGNIITVCNYSFFQNPKSYEATHETTTETTDGQPTGNRSALSINKNDKNVKNLEKENKETVFIPDWLPLELWNKFKEYRIEIKKPLSSYAEKLNINKLEKLKSEGNDPIKVIEETIMRGWQGFFPLKDDQRNQHSLHPITEHNIRVANNFLKKKREGYDR